MTPSQSGVAQTTLAAALQRRLHRAGVGISLVAVLLCEFLTLAAQNEPYFDGRKKELTYPGPGREQAEPRNLSEVKIGYFGPSDPAHPTGGDLWIAAQMAVERANATGGYKGLPFRLAPAWSENPWGSGVTQVTRLVYTDGVWALIGGIDGASTHLAEQVTAKALLPLVSPVSSDKTVNYAYVPWAFSISAPDDRQAEALFPLLEKSARAGRLVILSANDHDSKMAVREFESLLGRNGLKPCLHIEFEKGAPETAGPVEEVRAARAQAALVVADPSDSARMVTALRAEGLQTKIFGTFSMARREFLEKAGSASEGAIFAVSGAALDPSSEFALEFKRRAGRAPDYAAVEMYDATRLLLQAIQKAGLNRALIRDALRDLSGWRGLSGTVSWNPVAQNQAIVRLATVRNGAVAPLR